MWHDPVRSSTQPAVHPGEELPGIYEETAADEDDEDWNEPDN